MELTEQDRALVRLTQKLIQIPSWVGIDSTGGEHSENDLVDFLEKWIWENTTLNVVRQALPGGRFNLIAKKGEPNLVFLAHTDTVHPSVGAPYDQFAAGVHNDEIWGLGATDMKSGVAAMLQAISLSPRADNIWVFLYADEEYDFLGMKHIVKAFGDIRPKLLVSADGSDLKIGFGCRGCIEFRMRVLGQAGHAAKGTGNNAILGSFLAIQYLRQILDQYSHPVMGKTSMNLAYLQGGALTTEAIGQSGRLRAVGQNGNKVPDVAEFVLDIRPAHHDLSQETVIRILTEMITSLGLKVDMVERTHNLGSWFTEPNQLLRYQEIAQQVVGVPVELDKPEQSGYLDLQMIWEVVGRPNALMFGGGVGKTAHMPNEHIRIADLIKARNFFLGVITDHMK